MSSAGATRSTAPVEIAPSGIPSYSGAVPLRPCAKVIPPFALMALRPRAPSVPVPDSTIPMACSPIVRANESKNVSIGRTTRSTPVGRDPICKRPSFTVTRVWGGGT